MFAKSVVFAAMSLFAAHGAIAAALPAEDGVVTIMIATDAYSACNCPNNCDHTQGSSCKYYAGPSDTDDIIEGTCEYPNGNHLAKVQCTA